MDPKFDSIDEYGRLVLTTIQQDLVDYNEDKTVYDDYSFYMWFSDSCQSDLLTCMNNGIVDQSGLLGQNLSGKIEVELYTESKKELVRVPEGEKDEEGNVAVSYCEGDKYFATLELNGGSSEQNVVIINNGKFTETLQTPTRTDVITFDTNGGTTDNTSSQSVTYTFEGWYTDSSFSDDSLVTTENITVNSNIKLYAKWSGDNVITLPETTRTGYEFLGWYYDITLKNKAGDAGDTYVVDGSQTLYAKWKSNAYLVTYNSGNLIYGLNDVSTTSSTKMNYSISSGVITVTATGDDGYGFTTGRFYLEAGKKYIFKATSSGTWGVTSGSDTVEAYFMKDGTYSSDIPLIHPDTGTMNSSGEFIFTPTVTGTYWLRLDVNLSGKTHTFSDISVSYYLDSKEILFGQVYGEIPTVVNPGYTFLG